MPAIVPSPSKRTNSWLRTTAPPVVNRNSLKRACAPIAAISVETCSAPRALAGDLDVIDMRLVADHQLERGVDLIVRAAPGLRGSRPASRARPRSTTTSERANTDAGSLAGVDEDEMDRPRERGPGRDVDHRAVAHEGGVERDRRHRRSARPCRDAARRARSPAASACAIERMVRPGSSCGQIGQFRHERAVDEHDAARTRSPASSAPASFARAFAAASGAPASGLASRISARRSVYFHSSTRRCGRPSRSKRRNAASRRSATAPRPAAAPCAAAKLSASAVSAAVLIGRISACHVRLTPPRPGYCA